MNRTTIVIAAAVTLAGVMALARRRHRTDEMPGVDMHEAEPSGAGF